MSVRRRSRRLEELGAAAVERRYEDGIAQAPARDRDPVDPYGRGDLGVGSAGEDFLHGERLSDRELVLFMFSFESVSLKHGDVCPPIP